MVTHQRRPRVPARINVQMSDEMKTQLYELAEREYRGDFQALMRQTLQARLDGSSSQTDPIDEVRQVVAELDNNITRQHEDFLGGVNSLMERTKELRETAAAQRTDDIAIFDHLLDLKTQVERHNDAITHLGDVVHQLVERVATQSAIITKLSQQIASEQETINALTELIATEPRKKSLFSLGS